MIKFSESKKSKFITPKLQRGFTLIEVMVTVFIMAVGILGVAGMQAVSVRESGNLYHRTIADLLITDIVDRMRSNRIDARLGAGSGYDSAEVTGSVTTINCTAAACTPAVLATYDLNEWSRSMATAQLPSAVGTITFVNNVPAGSASPVGSIYTVRIFWDEDRDGDAGRGCDPSDEADMACSSLTVQI